MAKIILIHRKNIGGCWALLAALLVSHAMHYCSIIHQTELNIKVLYFNYIKKKNISKRRNP